MFEYRFDSLSEESIEILTDNGIFPVEEEFKGEGGFWLAYSEDELAGLIPEDYISKTPADDTGWEEKWKEFIKPGNLTETLRYDFDTDREPDSGTILINPSMAFGTGTHPTTRCAASLLERVCSGKTVADAGCGSGILALAAHKRGAERVYAFDIDPVALHNTYENIALNRAENIFAWAGGIESFGGSAEVVAANIITSVLTLIHPSVLRIKPEYIVYSGILDSEYDEFINSLDLTGYRVTDTNAIEEWRGVVLRCL